VAVEELVRGLVDALNRRDFDRLASYPLEPGFRFRSLISDAEGREYVGFDGLRMWAKDIDEVADDFHVDVLEVRPAGDETAVVMLRVSGRGKASGAPFEEHNAQVWRWRAGRLWRNDAYADPADALRAAGI
jgi:ketosteroid isomerase-like protein